MEFNLIPGEKLLIKLWDTIAEKGIGSLLKPIQARRMGTSAAEVKRLSSLMAAQTKIDVASIQSGKKVLLPNGKLEDISFSPQEIDATRASQLTLITEIEEIVKATATNEDLRREVSVAKAILYAEQELEQETQSSSETPISDDWLLRWRDNAASISSDELQTLWGKVLAGEVKSPGSFSLRSLEFLRNISREDAVLVEKVAPYVILGVIFRPSSADAVGELSFTKILELQEIGILSGVEALGMQKTYKSALTERFALALTCYGRLILVTHADVSRTLTLPIYSVTKIGREVLNLGWKRADEAYLQLLAERIKEMGFDIQIGDYETVNDSMINLSNMKDI